MLKAVLDFITPDCQAALEAPKREMKKRKAAGDLPKQEEEEEEE